MHRLYRMKHTYAGIRTVKLTYYSFESLDKVTFACRLYALSHTLLFTYTALSVKHMNKQER